MFGKQWNGFNYSLATNGVILVLLETISRQSLFCLITTTHEFRMLIHSVSICYYWLSAGYQCLVPAHKLIDACRSWISNQTIMTQHDDCNVRVTTACLGGTQVPVQRVKERWRSSELSIGRLVGDNQQKKRKKFRQRGNNFWRSAVLYGDHISSVQYYFLFCLKDFCLHFL